MQPLSQHSFSSTTSNTTCFLMYFISSVCPSLKSFGSVHVLWIHQAPFKLCGLVTFIWHWTCKVRIPNFDRTSRTFSHLMALKIATSSDARHSDAVSGFPVMRTCLRSCFQRPSPRRTSAISLELVSHLVPFLSNSFIAVRSSSTSDTSYQRSCTLTGRWRGLQPRAIFSSRNSWMKCFCISICNLHTSPGSSLSVLLTSISSGHKRMFNRGGLPARNAACSRICNGRSSVLSSARMTRRSVPLAPAAVKSTSNPSRNPTIPSRCCASACAYDSSTSSPCLSAPSALGFPQTSHVSNRAIHVHVMSSRT